VFPSLRQSNRAPSDREASVSEEKTAAEKPTPSPRDRWLTRIGLFLIVWAVAAHFIPDLAPFPRRRSLKVTEQQSVDATTQAASQPPEKLKIPNPKAGKSEIQLAAHVTDVSPATDSAFLPLDYIAAHRAKDSKPQQNQQSKAPVWFVGTIEIEPIDRTDNFNR